MHTGQGSISGSEGTADHIPGQRGPEVHCHCHGVMGFSCDLCSFMLLENKTIHHEFRKQC